MLTSGSRKLARKAARRTAICHSATMRCDGYIRRVCRDFGSHFALATWSWRPLEYDAMCGAPDTRLCQSHRRPQPIHILHPRSTGSPGRRVIKETLARISGHPANAEQSALLNHGIDAWRRRRGQDKPRPILMLVAGYAGSGKMNRSGFLGDPGVLPVPLRHHWLALHRQGLPDRPLVQWLLIALAASPTIDTPSYTCARSDVSTVA